MWESGGIKLHTTKNCLLRNNVIRHLRYAPGIWLDYGNANTRATANLIADIRETLRGGIYLEASHERNMLDHNVIWNVTMGERNSAAGITRDGGWGIINDGSDEAVVAHNLFGQCEDAGVKIRTVESRIVEGRGGTARWNEVRNNIFFRCGKSIELSHREHKIDGNLYARARDGLNWVATPELLRLDLPAWQKYLGFDKNGAYSELAVELDPDALRMTWSASSSAPDVATTTPFQRDFAGRTVGPARKPGPFAQLPAVKTTVSVDPRR
jgi:hypothetical protein